MADRIEVTARMRAHLRWGGPLALLVEIQFPDVVRRFWSHEGTLKYDGQDWTGVGVLGRVSFPTQGTSLAVQQVTLTMSGLPPAPDYFLGRKIKNCPATIWIAGISERRRVVPDPLVLADCILDYAKQKTESGKVTIDCVGNTGFVSIERTPGIAWTHEFQQTLYPGDSGLSLISSLTVKDSNWRSA